MYCIQNFKTKKALKQAVADGATVQIYQPGPFNKGIVREGTYVVEGPHFPEPHRWYASVKVKNFKVISVR